MSSDVTERPPRNKASPSRDQDGVVELPWSGETGETPQEKPLEKQAAGRDTPSDPGQHHDVDSRQETQPQDTRSSFWARAAVVVGVLVVVAIFAALLWWAYRPVAPKITYGFAEADIATVTVTARAQGRLAARDAVEVVAEVGGRLGNATAKSGDRVRKGQVLMQLSSETAQEQAASVAAEIASYESAAKRADADVAEARAMMAAGNGSPPGADAARVTRAVARADEARAALAAARTRLTAARDTLNGLEIRAPFDAIVLQTNLENTDSIRRVARGQSLFTLVPNFSEFDLTADIPESAIGPLRPGQQALFTVPAFPHRTFAARLDSIGVQSAIARKDGVDTVTTYPVRLSAANADGSLRPGMSADVAVILAQAKDVLTVPNATLLFRPAAEIAAKYPAPKAPNPAFIAPNASASAPARITGGVTEQPVTVSSTPHPARVWVLEGDTPKPHDIMVGLSDGKITQVVSGALRPGDAVITTALMQAGKQGA